MKTAMQLMLWYLENEGLEESGAYYKAKMLLEKEKEQLINFCWECLRGDNIHTITSNKELIEYINDKYNQTYNQKIPELLYKDGTPMRKVKLGEEAQELLDEVHNEKRGDLVRLLRWILKHYSTGTDIEGMFMWENPIGEEFDSIQVVDHYLKENK